MKEKTTVIDKNGISIRADPDKKNEKNIKLRRMFENIQKI